MTVPTAKRLRGADVRAKRNSFNPIIKQREVLHRLGWKWAGLLCMVENEEIELSQSEYQRIMAAVDDVRRERDDEGGG